MIVITAPERQPKRRRVGCDTPQTFLCDPPLQLAAPDHSSGEGYPANSYARTSGATAIASRFSLLTNRQFSTARFRLSTEGFPRK